MERVFVFLGCFYFICPYVFPQIPPLPEMSYAKVADTTKFQGNRWSFMEAGSPNAPAVIMLHGFGGSSVDWRYQLHELSDTYRVIAWNAPGYMLSDGLKAEKPTCRDYAAALADFLNTLRLTKVYLVGNSFGSRICQCFAYHYPERVVKMVFVGPSAGKNLSAEEIQKTRAFRRSQVAEGGYGFANKRVEALLAPNASNETVELARKGMRGVHPREFLRGVHFIVSNDHTPDKIGSKITAPVLQIAGTEDNVSPIPLNAEPLQKHLSNSKLEILKGVGHLPHLESPKVVNRMIRDFFGVKPENNSQYSAYQQKTITMIDSLMDYQIQMILAQDTAAMNRFYPEDMRITNPFHQLIDKKKMLERVMADIIKYKSYEKKAEHYHFEGDDIVIVIGKERVVPTNDANRYDAGKDINRRFTEVWVKRENTWKRLVRHAHNVTK